MANISAGFVGTTETLKITSGVNVLPSATPEADQIEQHGAQTAAAISALIEQNQNLEAQVNDLHRRLQAAEQTAHGRLEDIQKTVRDHLDKPVRITNTTNI